jgi:transcription elongation factor B subunit 1
MSEKPQTEYVTLVSNDGFEFVVKRSCAITAGAIKNMLDPTSMALRSILSGKTY